MLKNNRADYDYQYSYGAKEDDEGAGDKFCGLNSNKINKNKKSNLLEGIYGWMWIITNVVKYLHWYNATLASGQTIYRKLYKIKFTGQRSVASAKLFWNVSSDQVYGKCELDSYEDTIVAGANCFIHQYTGEIMQCFTLLIIIWFD